MPAKLYCHFISNSDPLAAVRLNPLPAAADSSLSRHSRNDALLIDSVCSIQLPPVNACHAEAGHMMICVQQT
jgi:hypothetical protein